MPSRVQIGTGRGVPPAPDAEDRHPKPIEGQLQRVAARDGAAADAGTCRVLELDVQRQRVDAAFVEQRQYTEFAFSRLEAKMDAGFGRVGRVERKLDQFIDVQLQANQLVERRLTALEQQPGRT